MDRIKSFEPIINKSSRILILGSIPGKESLRQNEYYAHPQNQFWRIIYTMYGISQAQKYQEKLFFLLDKGIALWDVVYSCYRPGSLDGQIREEIINDFQDLFSRHPALEAVYFNGSKAYSLFRKQIGFSIEQIKQYNLLPSTSPARTIPFDQKLTVWKNMKIYLENLDRF